MRGVRQGSRTCRARAVARTRRLRRRRLVARPIGVGAPTQAGDHWEKDERHTAHRLQHAERAPSPPPPSLKLPPRLGLLLLDPELHGMQMARPLGLLTVANGRAAPDERVVRERRRAR